MCVELHKQSTEALEMFRAIEEESKFIPSQFDQLSPVEQLEAGMRRASEAMRMARPAVEVLREIVRECDQTYDGTESFVRLPVELWQRAKALVQP